MGNETEVERQPNDYTGVAVWQMAEVFHKYNSTDLETVANRAGMSPRDLRKIVIEKRSLFTGLKVADRIFLALGQNITALALAGVITIIPAAGSNAPRKMAADWFWALDIEPTPIELLDRTHMLTRLRDDILSKS